MKVVFVHPSHPNQFTQIAYRLAKRHGWECSFLVKDVFSAQVRAQNPPVAFYGYHEEPDNDAIPYVAQPIGKGALCGKAVMESLAHLKAAGEVDVVFGHAVFGTTLFVRQMLGLPVVSYIELPGFQGLYCRPEYPANYLQSLTHVALQSLVYASVLNSDVSVVPSQHARNCFPAELRHHVRVQMEGFELPAPVQNRKALKHQLGLPEGAPVVGFAARSLESMRGFDIFVQVAKLIHRRLPAVQFLVLGDETTLYGSETVHMNGQSFKQYLWQKMEMNGEPFTFKPFMEYSQFLLHMQAMDIILFPIFEGAGNWGLFEAMAAGLPVLASNRCFVPEVITDGIDGLLFDPLDSTGLAAATESLLTHPQLAQQLAESARHTIATRFSVDNAASGYANIIEEAVARFEGRSLRPFSRDPAPESGTTIAPRGDIVSVATQSGACD